MVAPPVASRVAESNLLCTSHPAEWSTWHCRSGQTNGHSHNHTHKRTHMQLRYTHYIRVKCWRGKDLLARSACGGSSAPDMEHATWLRGVKMPHRWSVCLCACVYVYVCVCVCVLACMCVSGCWCRAQVSTAAVERSNESVHDHPIWTEGRRCIDPASALLSKKKKKKLRQHLLHVLKHTNCRSAEADKSSCLAVELQMVNWAAILFFSSVLFHLCFWGNVGRNF